MEEFRWLKKITSPKTATVSKVLRDGRASKASKTAAGSALSQREMKSGRNLSGKRKHSSLVTSWFALI